MKSVFQVFLVFSQLQQRMWNKEFITTPLCGILVISPGGPVQCITVYSILKQDREKKRGEENYCLTNLQAAHGGKQASLLRKARFRKVFFSAEEPRQFNVVQGPLKIRTEHSPQSHSLKLQPRGFQGGPQKHTNALSFYRSQNVLGWSNFFVPDQKFIYILWQSQKFCARQKDDLYSVKLVYLCAGTKVF